MTNRHTVDTTPDKPRLLVVDDDIAVLDLLTYVLKSQYAVTSCPDGLEALRLLETQPFDIVVTDLRLPNATGLDILNAARRLPDPPAVVIITGYATVDSAVQATNDGASAYVPKPFNTTHLQGIVTRALERRQLERELRESERRYRHLYQQAQQRVQELQLLFEASQLLGQPFDAQVIGERVIHILNRLFDNDDQQVRVLLFEDETDSLALAELSATLQGMAQEQWFREAALCPADCPVRAGRSLRLTMLHHDASATDTCPACQPETGSVLCAPVHVGEHVIGALHFETRSASVFTEPDERLLVTFAGQVTAVLEGLRTARQRERLAVLEEQDRMARALHDGLAQRFAYLGLTLDGLFPLLEQGRSDAAQDDLKRLRRVVDEGHKEIRTAITGLRQAADTRPLGTELAALVRRWGHDHQVAARFRYATSRSLQLPADQTGHLLGIVQEALNNIARHAQATQVQVTLTTRDDENLLSIADDGTGFDPAQVPTDGSHFGLIILEERAALLGGRLIVNSAPGQGTHIEVVWPSRGGETP